MAWDVRSHHPSPSPTVLAAGSAAAKIGGRVSLISRVVTRRRGSGRERERDSPQCPGSWLVSEACRPDWTDLAGPH